MTKKEEDDCIGERGLIERQAQLIVYGRNAWGVRGRPNGLMSLDGSWGCLYSEKQVDLIHSF